MIRRTKDRERILGFYDVFDQLNIDINQLEKDLPMNIQAQAQRARESHELNNVKAERHCAAESYRYGKESQLQKEEISLPHRAIK